MATIHAAHETFRVEDIDESTRLLCAGAHLDRDFADTAVAEFLTQPLRSLPPSPGVNPRAVLRECLAARRRRRIRDLILFALVVVYGALNPMLLLGWFVAAIVWRAIGPKRRKLDKVSRGGTLTDVKYIAGIMGSAVLLFVLSIIAYVVGLFVVSAFWGDGNEYSSPSGGDGSTGSLGLSIGAAAFGGNLLLAPFCCFGALGVLWYDRHAVWSVMIHRFRRGRFTPAAPPLRTGLERLLWGTGYSSYSENLRSLDAEHVNCVIYRGSRPFVGSGMPQEPWSIAIALEPARDGMTLPTGDTGPERGTEAGTTQKLSIIGLHNEVTREIARLGGETSLSPSHRLSAVRTEGMAFIPARCLAQHLGEPLLQEVIPDQRRRSNPQISGELLQQVAACPQEWMRYYATYIVESWDREVTVSVLMHYGLDDRNLYIECTPCVLHPVEPRYRAIDDLSERSASAAFLDALGSWTVLPLTILPRFMHAVRRVKDPFHGSDNPERLGVAVSLREIAASGQFTDYAQQADATRYVQILQTRIVRAVGSYLEQCDLSAIDFMRQADAVTVNTVIHGDVNHSVVGGTGHKVTVTGPTRPSRPGRA